MPIFKLSALETVRLLSGHILPRNESNFTHSHLNFKKKFPGRNLRTPAYKNGEVWKGKGRGCEGIKGFIPLKEAKRERKRKRQEGWEGKGGVGASGRGDLAPRS